MPGPTRFRRRTVTWVTAVVVLIVGLSVGLAEALPSGGSSRATSPAAAVRAASPGGSVRAASPSAADVSAARACAAFTTYLNDASKGEVPRADGQALAQAAGQLIAAAPAAQKAGKPLPKWTTLGEQLVAAGEDIVKRDSAALQKDGTAAVQICHTIPAAAAQAGGYTPGS